MGNQHIFKKLEISYCVPKNLKKGDSAQKLEYFLKMEQEYRQIVTSLKIKEAPLFSPPTAFLDPFWLRFRKTVREKLFWHTVLPEITGNNEDALN